MKTDIQIAQEAKMLHIREVAAQYGITEDDLEFYGKYKAKLTDELWDQVKDRQDGKLVLVTAINPTPAGEGKTTTTVGLGEAFAKMGKKALICILLESFMRSLLQITCWLLCWIIIFSREMHLELTQDRSFGNAV